MTTMKDAPTGAKAKRKASASAEKLAANDSNGVGTGAKAKAAAKPKPAPRFDPAISAAVVYARTGLHSKKPGLNGRRAPAASGGDHLRVREHLSGMIDGPVTAETVIGLTGMTLPRLERVAMFDPNSADDLKILGKLGKEFAKDKNASWRTGRYLAGVLVAWVVEMRATYAAAKKAAKE